MYTVCFTSKNGQDIWERCDSRREVAALLIREGLQDDPDVLIFAPEADDEIITTEEIFAGI